MPTYLVTWNPKVWAWEHINDAAEQVKGGKPFPDRWRTTSRKVEIGDRVFLLRQGKEPRGIVAAGRAVSTVYLGKDLTPEDTAKGIQRFCFDLEWDSILVPEKVSPLPRNRLDEPDLSACHWNTQCSGIAIPATVAARLEEVWQEHLGAVG